MNDEDRNAPLPRQSAPQIPNTSSEDAELHSKGHALGAQIDTESFAEAIIPHLSGTKLLDGLADQLFYSIRLMTDEQLESLLKAAKRVTSTNCPWIRAFAAPAVRDFANEEKRDRAARRHNEKRTK
jgi:hypothetical protein